MITRSKLPFSLTFETKKEGIISARRFTIDPDRLTGHFPAALALTENQDIFLRFEAPAGFRFTMDGLDVAGTSISCDETGGDYFDYRVVSRGGAVCLDTAVGDVTGHGVPSALLMATARALLLATEDSETPAGRVRRAGWS